MTDDHLSLYRLTDGYKIRSVQNASKATATALVQAKSTGIWSRLDMFLKAKPPEYSEPIVPFVVVGLGVHSIEAPVEYLPTAKLNDEEIRSKISTLMKTISARDAFSGTVQIWKGDQILFADAYGLAHRSPDRRNRVDTQFNLASITKMFTAVAIAQLAEEGKLSYSDTVGKIMPDYPNKEVATSVTVHQLLSHTSGLIGGRELAMKLPNASRAMTLQDRLKDFVNEPLTFPPGQQFGYSNAGYILLGRIIEKVSGISYYDYLRDRIFRPAAMTETGFILKTNLPDNAATGFMDAVRGQRKENNESLDLIGSPDGGAYSTGRDMARFHTALRNGTLLRPASLQTLWTGVTDNGMEEYAYGARLTQYNGVRIVGHGGGWDGITNEFDMYPDQGVTVIVLSNYDDDPTGIRNKLREWLTQGNSPVREYRPSKPELKVVSDLSTTKLIVGQPIVIRVIVSNTGGDFRAGIVNLDIRSSDGKKVGQKIAMDQRIEADKSKTFTFFWVPTEIGKFTFDIGIFGKGWQPTYYFGAAEQSILIASR
jgi:CubicO group peptidase (beta-lactamase class C family)